MRGRQEAVEFYNEGLNLAKEERHAEAVQALLEAVKIDPDYVNAYNLIGKIYMQEGDSHKAREYWMNTLTVDPFNSIAMECLEASHPRPFMGGPMNILRLFTFVAIIFGIAFILYKVTLLDRRVDTISVAGKTIETTGEQIPAETETDLSEPHQNEIPASEEIVDATPEIKATGSDIPPWIQPAEQELLQSQQEETSELIAEEKESPIGETVSSPANIPMTPGELESRYRDVVRNFVLKGEYRSALSELSVLKNSELFHRYAIGNSYFWSGICYKNLGEFENALRDFQRVTKENSHKFNQAQRELIAIEAKLQR